MLTHPTLDQLRALKLDGMAQAFVELEAAARPMAAAATGGRALPRAFTASSASSEKAHCLNRAAFPRSLRLGRW